MNDKIKETLCDYIDSQKVNMINLLEKMVNTDSGSKDKKAVDKLGQVKL